MSREGERYVLPERIGPREVLALAWPVIVSMLSHTLMTAVDAVFVGRLGTAPLAAIGLAAPVIFLTFASGNGLLEGVRVVTAQRHGAGDDRAVASLAWQAAWLVALLSVMSFVMIPFGRPLFAWMGATADVTGLADTYTAIRLLGAPLHFGLVALSFWFQGRGDTRTPMIASVTANVLDIVVKPLCVVGVAGFGGWGVPGAAWSTVASLGVGVAILAWRWLRLAGAERSPDRRLLAAVWDLGLPIGAQEFLEVAAFLVFAAVLAHAGDAHLAAHVVVVRIIMVSFLPSYAIGSAAGVLVGQAVGAGRLDAAWQAVRAALGLTTAFTFACAVAFAAVPGPLIGVFAPEADVVVLASSLMRIAAIFVLIDGVATVQYCALVGAGDTRFVMVFNVLIAWLVRVPLSWYLALPLGQGAPGAWWGFTVQLLVVAAVMTWRWRSGRWAARPAVLAPA